jgi:hypothetical protein
MKIPLNFDSKNSKNSKMIRHEDCKPMIKFFVICNIFTLNYSVYQESFLFIGFSITKWITKIASQAYLLLIGMNPKKESEKRIQSESTESTESTEHLFKKISKRRSWSLNCKTLIQFLLMMIIIIFLISS